MSKVERIEADLKSLSTEELQQLGDWLEELVEDRLTFTHEFESAISRSETEMTSGLRPRIRRP